MKRLIAMSAAVLLASCGSPAEEDTTAVAEAEAEAPAEAMALNETTWTFTREDQALTESIDAAGQYIVNAGEEHFDHGTYVMVDGKHCFTSAMTEEGQVCWTSPASVAVGETVDVTSDKGETLSVTRVDYQALTM